MQERRGGVFEGVAVRVAVAVGADVEVGKEVTEAVAVDAEVEVGKQVTEAVAVEAALVVRVGVPEMVLDSVMVALAVAVGDAAPVGEDSGEEVEVALAFAVLVEERVGKDVPQAVPVGDAVDELLLEIAAVEDGGGVALLDTEALPVEVAVARAVSVSETDEWLVTVALPGGVPELVAVSRVREPLAVEVPDEDAVAEALALHVDSSVPTELIDADGDAVEDADEVLQSVGSEVALEVAEAVTLEVGAGVAVPAPVEDPLLERDVFDVPVEGAEGVNEAIAVAVAVPEKLWTAVNEPVPVKDAVEEAVALVEADAVGETLEVQRSCTGSHALLTAQAGAPSSRVHAGPSATPSGHQEPPKPHPCDATTARNEAGAKVNTDEAAHAAEETPWQVSDGASHWRPFSHSVAERGPS